MDAWNRWWQRFARIILPCVLAAWSPANATADDLRVAVAANFKPTVTELCEVFFSERGGGRCIITSGASGLLFAQISQGAPFDVFLSADRARPLRLEQRGLAVPGTRFTYAQGRLVFWQPCGARGDDLREMLTSGTVATLALANPQSAPYGEAASSVLRALGLDASEELRRVIGENVTQAFQFVGSEAADAGFVSRAQIVEYTIRSGGSLAGVVIDVDESLYAPIEQQAVLLSQARDPKEARAFLDFLRSPPAMGLIIEAGYKVPDRRVDRAATDN